MRPHLVTVVVLLALTLPAPVFAQEPPRPPRRPIDFSLGGSLIAPVGVGSSSATLITPSGGELTLFDVESRFGPGVGAEATLGVPVSGAFWIEASGGWSRVTARSRISDDVELAPALTLTETIMRVSGEGALMWYFSNRGPTSWFARGSGGWMREITGGNTVVEDGWLGSGGVGVRHWWRENGTGALKRMGLRAEGRVLLRTSGVAFGSRSLRIAPAASAFVVFGF